MHSANIVKLLPLVLTQSSSHVFVHILSHVSLFGVTPYGLWIILSGSVANSHLVVLLSTHSSALPTALALEQSMSSARTWLEKERILLIWRAMKAQTTMILSADTESNISRQKDASFSKVRRTAAVVADAARWPTPALCVVQQLPS